MRYRRCNLCHDFKTKEFFSPSKWKAPESHNVSCKACISDRDRVSKPAEEGEIYIITNPAFQGWCKVGMASSSGVRLGSYNTGDPFRAYKLEYAIGVDDKREAERQIHEALEELGERRHEWFQVHVDDAKAILRAFGGTNAI